MSFLLHKNDDNGRVQKSAEFFYKKIRTNRIKLSNLFSYFVLLILISLVSSQEVIEIKNVEVPLNVSSKVSNFSQTENEDNLKKENLDGALASHKNESSGGKVEEILRQIFSDELEEEELEDEDFLGSHPLISNSEIENFPKAETLNNFRQVRSRNFGKNDFDESASDSTEEDDEEDENSSPKRRPASKLKNKNQNTKLRQNRPQNNKNSKNKKSTINKNGNKKNGIDLSKYNAYMDAVLGRMNLLIRKKRMDPLRVNLYAGASGGKRRKNNNRDEGRQHHGNFEANEENGDKIEDEDENYSVRDVTLARGMRGIFNITREDPASEEAFSPEETDAQMSTKITDILTPSESPLKSEEGRGKDSPSKKTENGTKNSNSTNNRKNNKNKEDNSSKSKESELGNDKRKNKNKNKGKNSPRPTRGILHGLSSLRRDGNVQVIKDGERARIVRAKFLLGPVALEILPKKTKKGGSSKEELEILKPSPAATATAPQLKGILEIRLSPQKPTRIRKLRVFPPSKINVEGDKNKNENENIGMRRGGYRKVTPMATARLRQAAVQVVRQVDNKMRKKS